MKLMCVTSDSSATTGIGPSLVDALACMDRSTLSPIVICPWEAPNSLTIGAELRQLGIRMKTQALTQWLVAPDKRNVKHFARQLSNLKSNVWSLATTIERESIDVVYTTGLPCPDGAIAARLTRKPHIWHVCEALRDNSDLSSYLPHRVVARIVAESSSAVIANSHFLASELRRYTTFPSLSIIPNGVDLSRFSPASGTRTPNPLWAQLGLAIPATILIAVGSVVPRKGYATLIRALGLLANIEPRAVLVVVGSHSDSSYLSELQQLAQQLDLSARVHFVGPRSDISSLLADADIFVHSANQETFGRVIVEAMAAGKPVVTTRSGGPQEIVVDGVTGFVVEVGDEATLASRIRILMRDRELRRLYGHAGRERAFAHFSRERYAQAIQRIIRDAAERHGMS